MRDEQSEVVSERDADIEGLRRDVAETSMVIKEILKLNERMGRTMDSLVRLDTKVSDIQETQLELQNLLARQQTTIDMLVTWHNNQKAITNALGWLIDKAPTLAAVAVFCFWALNEWTKKEGSK